MSESEFDAYLSLLGKLLNLSAKQRAHISDELRDHLEERFHALLDQGTPRDEALRAAVEELGDAAALAQQFTLPYHIRRRRQLMRYSLGSAVVIATTFVMAAFYWPANRPEPALQLQAQDAPRTTDVGSPHARKPSDLVSAQASKTASIRDDLTAKLEFRDFELKLDDVPWPEAIQFLSDVSDVDVLVDRRYVEESGVAMETPVQLKARPGALSVRSAMELILEQVAGMQLAYAVRDGVILISSPDNAYENRVYDCRDLLEGVVVHQPGGVVGGGGGFGGGGGGFGGGGAGGGHFQVRAEMLGAALQPTMMAQIGGLGGGGFGGEGGLGGGMGGGGMMQSVATSAAGPTLINVIQEATAPAHWVSREGQGGTVTEYDGLLIVRHQPRVHHKIEELLDQIRTVRANKRSDVPQVGIAPIPTLTRDEFIAIEPTSEAPALRRTDAVATLTIEAVLELGGVDPKSVQWNTPVWLETATMTRGAGDTVHHVVNGVARIQRIDGPGKRPDTLQILITGPAAMLSEVQKAYGDQGVTVWLKKPTSKPQPPANVKPPAAAPEGSDVFGDAPQFRPQSVSHATFPQEDTLTIGAVLELSGIDPKAVQAGAGVWTDRVELPVTDAMKLRMGGRHLSSGMAMLKYVGGPGEQSGTLQVRIEGPVRELEALKRKANGQPVRVWLKRPLPVDNQPVGF